MSSPACSSPNATGALDAAAAAYLYVFLPPSVLRCGLLWPCACSVMGPSERMNAAFRMAAKRPIRASGSRGHMSEHMSIGGPRLPATAGHMSHVDVRGVERRACMSLVRADVHRVLIAPLRAPRPLRAGLPALHAPRTLLAPRSMPFLYHTRTASERRSGETSGQTNQSQTY